MDPDGKNPHNLSNNSGDDFYPVWSPDGSRIAFVSNRENDKGGGQFIYVMDADGSHVRQLSSENESNWPDWSPDGSHITYTNKGDIYGINADGSGQAVNLTNSPEDDQQPVWSPDSSKIAWIKGEKENKNVFVMDADGSDQRQITDNNNAQFVKWTEDGRILTSWGWAGQNEFCHNCVVNVDSTHIVDAGGKGNIQRYLPFWTTDGQRIEAAEIDQFDGNSEIYLIGDIFPDGLLNITQNTANDRHPDWPANCGPVVKPPPPGDKPQPKDPQSIVIGYAGGRAEQDQRKIDFQKACDELGIQCVSGEISDLVNRQVDAIIQNARSESTDVLTPDLSAAIEKGIPVFVLEAEVDAKGVYNITVDRQRWINAPLEWMITRLNGKGQFAVFDFQTSLKQGTIVDKTLEQYSQIEVVTRDVEKYNFNESKSFVGDLMNDFPDLKAIWANDARSIIVLGMADTGLAGENWPLLTCEPTKEGFYIWKDRLAEHPGMQCVAVSLPAGIAYDAVYAAYDLASGLKMNESALAGPYGNSLYVDFPLITNDNLADEMKKIEYEDDRFTADRLMTPDEIKENWFIK